MDDEKKTRAQLMAELADLRKQVGALSRSQERGAEAAGRLQDDGWRHRTLQATRALQESEAKLQSIFRAAPIGIGLVIDRVFQWTNDTLHEMTGYSGHELLGQSARMLYETDEAYERVGRVKYTQIEGQGTGTVETRFVRKDGRVIDVLLSSTPLDTADLSQGVTFTALDITDRKRAEEALRRRTEQLEALRQVGLELTTELNLDVLLRSMVTRAVELLDGIVGGLYLYRPEDNVLELVVAVGIDQALTGTTLRPGEGLAGRIWQTGHPLIVDDYRHWDGRVDTFEDFAFEAVLGVPIRWGAGDNAGDLLGVLDVVAATPRTFSTTDLELLSMFATQAAIAIKNAHLFQAEQQRRTESDALRQASLILGSTLERDQVLEQLLDQIANVIPYDSANVMWLQDEVGAITHQRGRERAGTPEATAAFRQTVDEFPNLRQMFTSRRPHIVSDTRTDPDWVLLEPTRWIRSWAGAPIVLRGEVVAFFSLDSATPGFYTAEHADLLAAFAAHAAAAIENARLLEAERQQRELAVALRQAAAAVSSTLDLNEVLDHILEQVNSVIPGDAAKIMFVEGDLARVMRWRGYEPFDAVDSVAGATFRIDEAEALHQMRETGSSVVIPDTRTYAGWVQMPGFEWILSYAAAPICVRDRVVGFLTVESATPGFFKPIYAQHLQTFAGQASLAIQNARLYEDLQRQMSELQKAQSQLVQSAKMAAVGELAAGVAHELNNPLTSVLGFAELLMLEAAPDDPNRQDLIVITEEARRARNIVRGLLDFSRQAESLYEESDVNQVVQESLALVRRQIEIGGIELVEAYAPGLPHISLDVGRMKQVFLNLLTNAVQAMPGGGRLDISSRRVGDEAVVRIADTGDGIPSEYLARVFEPFFTTKPVGQGTGLGLSVSLGIVQEHGGRITVDSRPRKGSVFSVWLPVGTMAGEVADGE